MTDHAHGDRAHAARILAAFDDRRPTSLPSAADPGFDDRRGYGVAAELRALREARGAVAVGRKIGFTNPALMAEYGVAAPITGTIYDRGVQHAANGHARVAIGHLLQPKIEPEIQLHFAASPSIGATDEEILDCVDWMAHGFEFVQNPYPEWRFTSADAIAAGSLHALLLLGPPVAVAAMADPIANLRTFAIVLEERAGTRAAGLGADVFGSPLRAVAALAEPPAPGEIISTGSITAALRAAPGQTWTTRVDGIELDGLTVELVP